MYNDPIFNEGLTGLGRDGFHLLRGRNFFHWFWQGKFSIKTERLWRTLYKLYRKIVLFTRGVKPFILLRNQILKKYGEMTYGGRRWTSIGFFQRGLAKNLTQPQSRFHLLRGANCFHWFWIGKFSIKIWSLWRALLIVHSDVSSSYSLFEDSMSKKRHPSKS